MNAFNQLSPQINTIFNSDESVLKKTKFTYNYITFVIDNPYLPPFVIQEMNNNPEYVMKFLNKITDLTSANLPNWKGNKVGIIKPINQSNFWLISSR
jgi:hypothetical protein